MVLLPLPWSLYQRPQGSGLMVVIPGRAGWPQLAAASELSIVRTAEPAVPSVPSMGMNKSQVKTTKQRK